jgi:hypothetical protein
MLYVTKIICTFDQVQPGRRWEECAVSLGSTDMLSVNSRLSILFTLLLWPII